MAARSRRTNSRGAGGGRRWVRWLVRLVLLLLALIAGRWLLAPAAFTSTAYKPRPGVPLAGQLAANHLLRDARLIAQGRVHGGEDIAIDRAGRVYTGTVDGQILRITPAETPLGEDQVETFANTLGRPLGLRFDGAGNLLVADARRGLLRVSPEGVVETLATTAGGIPFRFTDGVDVARDGTVYFSDASSRWDVDHYLYDLLETKPNGRLLAWDPASKRSRVLMDSLYFANGVALASDESFVLVNETYRYRIARYWLKGPQRGMRDIFVDDLPGFPDGVASDGKGTIWVSLFTVRKPLMDRLHPHPWAKQTIGKLPRALWPKPEPYGLVVAYDERGQVVASLHDPGGERVREIASARPAGDWLYLGTLHRDWIARVRIPPRETLPEPGSGGAGVRRGGRELPLERGGSQASPERAGVDSLGGE